jgi:ATP-dependent Lhr-like helicase
MLAVVSARGRRRAGSSSSSGDGDARGALHGFHPAVVDWFTSTYPAPTPPQAGAWPAIRDGRSTLVFAPTGTGKTLAAFLGCLDRLFRVPVDEAAGKRRCRVLYVSPLKALAGDVERNLQAPMQGIAAAAAARGDDVVVPTVAVRTGDTDARARARFARSPDDILITTPESLALILTSKARAALQDVETVIVDEIHALVPTKRGAHLALCLARLEHQIGRPLQRIGLSATQKPLHEVARFLGGARADEVVVVDARVDKVLALSVEDTVLDPDFAPPPTASSLSASTTTPSCPMSSSLVDYPAEGTWATVPPRIVALAAQHRTTLVFVNSRRLAERLTAAINDVAGHEFAAAHHGSLARAQRADVESRVKHGDLRVLVATSSMELGVDLASVDVVVQLDAPPSVASALQRVGRAGHQVGATSRGVLMPRTAVDLLACASLTAAMADRAIESTHIPQHPLDVLMQHITAMAALSPVHVDEVFAIARAAAPYAALPRPIFDACVDVVCGKAAIDLGLEDFDALRGRLRLDEATGLLHPRQGTQRVVVQNTGTIPDRGLYGVFLAGDDAKGPARRVGELDEEMVFESRVGEVVRLGASSWRIEEITPDRVLVSPAPGLPGKLPFWRGEQALRTRELGERMGALCARLVALDAAAAGALLVQKHALVPAAAGMLVRAVREQHARAGGVVPDDRTFVVERSRDELGDWLVCVLSPLGGTVLQPLALAVQEQARHALGVDVSVATSNDGFVVRFPQTDHAPDVAALFPRADDVEALVVAGLSSSATFAARFREAASRALLLTKRRPGQRTALWKQRLRAQDLAAAVAARPDFPLTLEACREVLVDHFDVPGLVHVLRDVAAGRRRVVTVDVERPTPFAASLLSTWLRSALYDGDAPPAERRAQALSIDLVQLRALLGEGVLRELLDEEVVDDVEASLQRTAPGRRARTADEVHDLLVQLGDLDEVELAARLDGDAAGLVDVVEAQGRATRIVVGGRTVLVAADDLARYGRARVTTTTGSPTAATAATALAGLVRRALRTHAMTTTATLAARWGIDVARVDAVVDELVRAGEAVRGALRPGGVDTDVADANVLQTLRRRTLARLRRAVAAVPQATFVRALHAWHGVAKTTTTRRAETVHERLLDVIAQLQGTAFSWSALERDILPARCPDYRPEHLDALAAAGEVVWIGVAPLGERDARVMLFLTADLPLLFAPPPTSTSTTSAPATTTTGAQADAVTTRVLGVLRERGALFSQALATALGPMTPTTATTTTTTTNGSNWSNTASRPPSFSQWQQARAAYNPAAATTTATTTVEQALWTLVFSGRVTNDTFHPLRARLLGGDERGHGARARALAAARLQRRASLVLQGRWSAVPDVVVDAATLTARAAAVAQQLLRRHMVVGNDLVAAAVADGGNAVPTAAVKHALRALEDAGRIRRGFFVQGMAGLQYALPDAVELLRAMAARQHGEPDDDADDADEADDDVVLLAATDPAQPFGAALPWPAMTVPASTTPSRAAGAHVVLSRGRLALFVPKNARRLLTFLPDDDNADADERARVARAAARALARRATSERAHRRVLRVEALDDREGTALVTHPFSSALVDAGFVADAGGYALPSGFFAPGVVALGASAGRPADDGDDSDGDVDSFT